MAAPRSSSAGGSAPGNSQFHLARNAIHHALNATIRKRIGTEPRAIWNAPDLPKVEAALSDLVASYCDAAPKLAEWLEENVPEGLTVFALPGHHRCRLRTSSPIERAIQQELKRRTVKVRVFPDEESLERLVSTVLVEIDKCWAADTKAYIKWECQGAWQPKSQFPDNRLRNHLKRRGSLHDGNLRARG